MWGGGGIVVDLCCGENPCLYLEAVLVDWRRFSNTFISSYAYMRGPLKSQVNWPKKSILAENTLENTKINVFEIQY